VFVATAKQKRDLLPIELLKDVRKVRSNHGIPRGWKQSGR
jgi:hypothetical protein